jgi:integrase
MPTRSLTAASVARVKPPKSGQRDLFDAGYPGLSLRVSYGGARTWIYFYRLHNKLRRLSLGRYPAMSLDEARAAWRIARLAVSKGENPAHVRPTRADTFAAVAEDWLKRDQAHNRSAGEVRRTIERDVLPVWGDRLIAGIGRRDVAELVDRVVDRGATTMARRLHSHLHRLFRWSVGRGIIEVNPMADLPKPGSAVRRDRVLDDTELAAIWKAAAQVAWPFGPAIRLLVLTAARREEIGSLRWSEIAGDEIRLPAERSKNKEPRVIPLSPAAIEIIEALPRRGDYVFSANGSGLGGWSKAKRALDAAIAKTNGGPLPPWRLHDLRRTVATDLQRLGVGLQVIESILGHISGSRAGVTGVYQRYQFEAEMRDALSLWAQELERLTGGRRITGSGALRAGTAKVAGRGHTPISQDWVAAVQQADKDSSFEPLRAYLQRPGARPLYAAEMWWLDRLLKRLQFKRNRRGARVPLGTKSKKEQYEIGAAFVRDLQRNERHLESVAIDIAVMTFPQWFGADAGKGLASYLQNFGTK